MATTCRVVAGGGEGNVCASAWVASVAPWHEGAGGCILSVGGGVTAADTRFGDRGTQSRDACVRASSIRLGRTLEVQHDTHTYSRRERMAGTASALAVLSLHTLWGMPIRHPKDEPTSWSGQPEEHRNRGRRHHTVLLMCLRPVIGPHRRPRRFRRPRVSATVRTCRRKAGSRGAVCPSPLLAAHVPSS